MKPSGPARKRQSPSRPRLPPISEEMKAWSTALKSDVETWPQVTTRPMFGFPACYRRDKIFALLPKTRGLESPSAVAFKLLSPKTSLRSRIEKDPRFDVKEISKACWFTFELHSDPDLHEALEWLSAPTKPPTDQPYNLASFRSPVLAPAGRGISRLS